VAILWEVCYSNTPSDFDPFKGDVMWNNVEVNKLSKSSFAIPWGRAREKVPTVIFGFLGCCNKENDLIWMSIHVSALSKYVCDPTHAVALWTKGSICFIRCQHPSLSHCHENI
jgi:hypothetical protein